MYVYSYHVKRGKKRKTTYRYYLWISGFIRAYLPVTARASRDMQFWRTRRVNTDVSLDNNIPVGFESSIPGVNGHAILNFSTVCIP